MKKNYWAEQIGLVVLFCIIGENKIMNMTQAVEAALSGREEGYAWLYQNSYGKAKYVAIK